MVLGSYDGRLCLCCWERQLREGSVANRVERGLCAIMKECPSDITDAAARSLDCYFAGRGLTPGLPLLPVGTDFQKAVWQALLSIPYGQTTTYGELAAALGSPKAVRAVAAANGANAISIFVPCHRVIGRDGALTGYAGGLATKQFLLDLEKATAHEASR